MATQTVVKIKSRRAKVQDAPLFAPGKNLKRCSWCAGYYRPVPRNFHRDVQKSDKLSCWCRTCSLLYGKGHEKRHLLYAPKKVRKANIPVSKIMQIAKTAKS